MGKPLPSPPKAPGPHSSLPLHGLGPPRQTHFPCLSLSSLRPGDIRLLAGHQIHPFPPPDHFLLLRHPTTSPPPSLAAKITPAFQNPPFSRIPVLVLDWARRCSEVSAVPPLCFSPCTFQGHPALLCPPLHADAPRQPLPRCPSVPAQLGPTQQSFNKDQLSQSQGHGLHSY